jgi:predicted RNA binding protein YcfA (HicA-like mRNA interferase family)
VNGYEKLVKELLRKHGWSHHRSEKGSHDIWIGPNGRTVSVNHVCKSRHTANAILKEAGINHRFSWAGYPLPGMRHFASPHFMIRSVCLSICVSRPRCRFASDFAFPSAVFGPVLLPPWSRHRFLPGSLRASQGWPSLWRVAPQGTRLHFELFGLTRCQAQRLGEVLRNARRAVSPGAANRWQDFLKNPTLEPHGGGQFAPNNQTENVGFGEDAHAVKDPNGRAYTSGASWSAIFVGRLPW